MRHDIRRTNARGKAVGRFGEQISRSIRAPQRFLTPNRGWPHQIQHRSETDFNIKRACALGFIGNDRDRFIERNKKLFADDKIWPGVDTRCGFRTVNNSAENVLAINPGGFTLPNKSYSVGADDLHWISPDLQTSLRIAEDCGAAPVDRDESPRPGRICTP